MEGGAMKFAYQSGLPSGKQNQRVEVQIEDGDVLISHAALRAGWAWRVPFLNIRDVRARGDVLEFDVARAKEMATIVLLGPDALAIQRHMRRLREYADAVTDLSYELSHLPAR
jgi:hypothetical protein